ncbi:MAG: uncharacterized protein KVP18_004567 [Porospora cf. gigantea A]|uniref:uncharacterized protein n=1 Tax=Porospora cf. gigantea A TaxID=2853593 RepID=UPI00355ABAF7|nr:MAG: hypothetical protein KVP18_004567 [Porospora cf. gigantea A]
MTCANSVVERSEQEAEGDCEVLLSDRDGSECPVDSPSSSSVSEREVITVDFCENRGIKRSPRNVDFCENRGLKRLPRNVDRQSKRHRAEDADQWDHLTYDVTQECCAQLRAHNDAIVRALLQTLETRTAAVERSMAAFVAQHMKINKPKV